jgi:hypothetical protein
MAKDPRFNFYPDNWSGGTKRMNFIQKGAYLELILLNFYCFSDGLVGFTEEEALKTLASAPAYAELWNFLKPKFETDGAFYWSERMRKEFHKAKKSSGEQSKRALKRWEQNPASIPASHTALPVNGYGNGNGIDSEEKGVQGEKELIEKCLADSFDDIMLESIKSTFPKLDVPNELKIFQLKVRGSPGDYSQHQVSGLRKAFIHQLSKSTSSNGNGNGIKKPDQPTTTIIEPGKSFGVEKGFSRSGSNRGGN